MLSRKLFRSLTFGALLVAASSASAQDRPVGTAVKDAWITTQIQAKYFGDSVVKGRHIDVDTTSGIVTLTGEVSSATERQRAVVKAKEVDGVTRVVDRLTIGRGEKGTVGVDKADKAADKPKENAEANKVGDKADRLGDEISDAWITTKVQSKYYLDSEVKGLQIDVTTNGGVVTLTGKVSSADERQKALALAKSTDGVKQVIDKLTAGK